MKQSGAMLLVNRDGKVLLVHPAGWYNRNAPWMPPKEEVEAGESAEDAARRALVEELGLSPDSYELADDLGRIQYRSGSKSVFCYSARYFGADDAVTLDRENDRYGWYGLAEAKAVIKDEFVPILERLSID